MCGEMVHPPGDFPESLRPVINRVHRSHDGEQDLRGADVARRLVAADVLLAGLEREAHRGLALRVVRDADEPARHLALELILRGEESGVWPTIAERHTETLGGT